MDIQSILDLIEEIVIETRHDYIDSDDDVLTQKYVKDDDDLDSDDEDNNSHKYQKKTVAHKRHKNTPIEINIQKHSEEIFVADEREYSIKSFKIKQKRRSLSETEKFIFYKLNLIDLFGITNTDDRDLLQQFLEEYGRQEMTFRRFENFFGYDDSSTIGDDVLRREIIVDILNRLLRKKNVTYTSDVLIDTAISGAQYEERMLDIRNNSIYFKDEVKSRSLFFAFTYKPPKSVDKQHYSATVRMILQLYGINFNINGRNRINGKRMRSYFLSVN